MRSKAAAHLRSPPFHAFDDGNMLGAAAHNEREREKEREREDVMPASSAML